ncbi:MAG: TIGR04282 family arsenosugar biosynthesis glycosyltransferase [Verrucomicrobia bacterium]|nr:TIGR04282 family arsenosugar biosynthesis glycosyltransferase [Verrucomicrobiota bacterium]
MTETEKLLIFLKAPRPGCAKTRLAEALGPAAAALAYRTLVEALLSRFTGCTGIELHYAPEDALEEIRPWLKPSWIARPQSSGDLGQRLQTAFRNSFAAGAKRTVIIGSDCPAIQPEDIQAAWSALAGADVVLGPAADGGYWLIGLNAPQEHLFKNIPWSTETVLRESLNRCQTRGLRVDLLRELRDVDTKEDWQAYLRSLTSPHV